MEMQSSRPDPDDLRQLLVDAKLAGSHRDGGGYWFRSNEEAAELALDALGDWLGEHVDPDQLVIQAALRWYDSLVEVGHYSAEDRALNHSGLRSDKWPPEVALAAAVERLKGYA